MLHFSLCLSHIFLFCLCKHLLFFFIICVLYIWIFSWLASGLCTVCTVIYAKLMLSQPSRVKEVVFHEIRRKLHTHTGHILYLSEYLITCVFRAFSLCLSVRSDLIIECHINNNRDSHTVTVGVACFNTNKRTAVSPVTHFLYIPTFKNLWRHPPHSLKSNYQHCCLKIDLFPRV